MKFRGGEVERARVLEGAWDVWGVVREIAESGLQEDPFYVLDLGDVVAKYKKWREVMPRVEPFYAVKCNDSPMMLRTLAALGTGFDCASKQEISSVLQLGVRPERIIFANPAKMASHIRYAAAAGVNTMTFDNETELVKVKSLMPHAKLVIRIRSDAREAQCQLGMKFGCDPVTEAPRLLKLAAVYGLEVVGVSFHVGSGCQEVAAFTRAIHFARALFDMAACVGHKAMRILDIGGGFPGNSDTSIDEMAREINSALETHFPDDSVQVIAEPGRFFAASAYTLACAVYSKRELSARVEEGVVEAEKEAHTMYFINDGVYGSFNCVLYDHQVARPEPLNVGTGKVRACSVWGPSCDGLDCVVPAARLPSLQPGDWLVFRDMGAYTLPIASAFNGFPVPAVRTVIDAHVWTKLKDLWPFTEDHFVVGGPMEGPQEREEEDVWAPPPPRAIDTIYVECALK